MLVASFSPGLKSKTMTPGLRSGCFRAASIRFLIFAYASLVSGLGTPNFMAPEQFEDAKRVDARGDLYSLAATLYMTVTGELPFRARSARAVATVYKKKLDDAENVHSFAKSFTVIDYGGQAVVANDRRVAFGALGFLAGGGLPIGFLLLVGTICLGVGAGLRRVLS